MLELVIRRARIGAVCGGLSCLGLVACGKPEAHDAGALQTQAATAEKVGYDVRRLRPRNDEPLVQMFERMREQALGEGKVAAVLFSADWCQPCRRLDLELGNMHPTGDIGHVRIFEVKEEDWEAVTRMNEVNELRHRYAASVNEYPVLIVLDSKGERVEEMKEAIERLESANREPTLAAWLREHRPTGA